MRNIWLLGFCLLLLVTGSVMADTSDCQSPGVPISEDPMNPTESVINVAASETIVDVDVRVEITHDWIADLEVDVLPEEL